LVVAVAPPPAQQELAQEALAVRESISLREQLLLVALAQLVLEQMALAVAVGVLQEMAQQLQELLQEMVD
jgi:hypothetical protein